MLDPNVPALILAPMDGITDGNMRGFQGRTGAFSFAVTEFVRVSHQAVPVKVFVRDIPELTVGAKTSSGLSVQVQLLGGHPVRMAQTAVNAVEGGATAIDINFGCPAPTVNRNDGGASLLRTPCRIREVVSAVRSAVPATIPVSAKVRLGWDSIDDVYENAMMAAEGGASWLTIHARTRVQGYSPPVFWKPIGKVRRMLDLPVVANGDIWSLEDFDRCREETGCIHFMIGRGALANPAMPYAIARALGLGPKSIPSTDWLDLFGRFAALTGDGKYGLQRIKQWTKLANLYGDFPWFEAVKRAQSVDELLDTLRGVLGMRTLS